MSRPSDLLLTKENISPLGIAQEIDEHTAAVDEMWSGPDGPSHQPGRRWLDTASTPWLLKISDGTIWHTLMGVDEANARPYLFAPPVFGASSPTVTYPWQTWVDTSGSDPLVRMRNAGNDGWIDLASAGSSGWLPYYQGTAMAKATQAQAEVGTNSDAWMTPERTRQAIASLEAGKLVGEVFALWDHLDGVDPPDNSASQKFVRLTADEDGPGGYNEGLLTNESISGSSPLVEATAEIVTGPLQGQTIHLVNTEEAFVRARETSGALQMDQMQRIEGSVSGYVHRGASNVTGTGAMSGTAPNSSSRYQTGDDGGDGPLNFDSDNSPNARASSSTTGETRAKNVSATHYLRIA